MKKLPLLLSLLVMSLFTFQCAKEKPHQWADTPTIDQPTQLVKGNSFITDIAGIVIDEAGLPVSGAHVKVGSKTYQTNQFGLFMAAGAPVHENIAFVLVEKTGYFHGSRSFIPQASGNKVTIRMLRQDNSISFNAAEGGTISAGKAEIKLGAGFVDESGAAYTGNVTLTAKYLDPESSVIHEIMPGDLRGMDAEGESALETFGMIAAELTGSSGQKLQPSATNPATISVGLSATLLARAPATIPLWHFNETDGIWVHEGEANLVNGSYVGQVKHFSFWNCDVPFDVAYIKGSVVTEAGNPISNVNITLIRESGDKRTAYVNAQGKVSGAVQANEVFTAEVTDLSGMVLTRSAVGPFASNAIVEEIVVSGFETKITGILRNCDGSVPEGSYIFINKTSLAEVKNGVISFGALGIVGTKIQCIAISESGVYSAPFELTLDGEQQDIGTIELCDGAVDEGELQMSYEIGGVKYEFKGLTEKTFTPGYLTFAAGGALDSNIIQTFLLVLEFPLASDNKQVLTPTSKGFVRLSTPITPYGYVTAEPINVEVGTELVNGKERMRVSFYGYVTEYDPATSKYVKTRIDNGVIEQR